MPAVSAGTVTRGGRRPGAGRPAGSDRVMISVRLPGWLVEWLRAQPESQAALIEEALRQGHKLTPPNPLKKPR